MHGRNRPICPLGGLEWGPSETPSNPWTGTVLSAGATCTWINSTSTWGHGGRRRNGPARRRPIHHQTLKARQRPYHQQKLALVLTNLRHFALEAQEAGHPVIVVHDDRPYETVLEAHIEALGPLRDALGRAGNSARPRTAGGQGLLTVEDHGVIDR